MIVFTQHGQYSVNQLEDVLLVAKRDDKLLNATGKGENTLEINKNYECMEFMVDTDKTGYIFLTDRVIKTTKVWSTIGSLQQLI